MNDQKTIRILADLFCIAPSALRYWDREGLIRFERNKENNYRVPTIQTMMDICNVLLYRGLATPVKVLRDIPLMSEDEINVILSKNEVKLKQQIVEIQKSIEYIHSKQGLLCQFRKLRNQGFMVEYKTLIPIKEFSFQDKNDIYMFVNHPYESAILLNTANEIQYGLFSEDKEGKIIRAGDLEEKKYLKGVFKIASEDEKDNNYEEFFERAKAENGVPGKIAGRFLVSVFEERRYDFYEAWMELMD